MAARPTFVMGAMGLRKVRYLGEWTGKFRGPESCAFYPFSPEDNVRWVDLRDVAGLCGIVQDDGSFLFEVV